MELEQILNALKLLSEEEKAKAMEVLSEAADVKADEAVEVKAEDVIDDAEAGKADDEPVEQTGGDDEQIDEAVQKEDGGDGDGESEPIPEMTKAGAIPPVEESAALPDDQGSEMPIDYRQIIDGLNAKNAALEAEISRLKTKVEGAFGLAGKPSAFAPVNPLYGNTDDIPRMRK